jgi:hypothetical protein
MDEDGCCGELMLQVHKGSVDSWRPWERYFGRGECREGGHQGAVTANETVVEVSKTQETLQLHPGCWLRPIHLCFHLSRIHLVISLSDDISQERDCRAVELTLLGFHKQLVLQEALKDLSDMKNMFLGRPGKKQDVVKVGELKTL